MRRRLNLEIMSGAGVLVLAGAAALGAMRFPATSGAVPGPAMFPLLVAGLWTLFGLALLAMGWRKAAPVAAETPALGRMAGLFGLTVGYALLLPLLGFIAASALFLTVAIRFLGYGHGWRAGAVALATAFVVYWLFASLMKVPLPEGWIG